MALTNSKGKVTYKQGFFEKEKSKIVGSNYIRLLQVYWSKTNSVHLFVENIDDFEFYRTFVKFIYRSYEPIAYRLEGKKNVIDAYEEINWKRFKRSKVLFFADKDYDDLLKKPQVEASNFFYTRYYSIENYLVNEPTFRIVLSNFFTKMDNELTEKLVAKFNFAHSLFIHKLKALTRFILIYREIDKDLDLDKFKMSYFIHIENMELLEKRLVLEYNYNRIKRDPLASSLEKSLLRKDTISEILVNKCGAAKEIVTFSKIMLKEVVLNSIPDPHIFIRGKYALWFFMEMIQSADHAIKAIYEQEKRKFDQTNPIPKMRSNISQTFIFDLLASKLDIPKEIEEFLMYNYKLLNENN
jgi:hypothetical protein